MIIRLTRTSDAPAMGRLMVDTFLRAHKGQMPEGAWQRRREEWTWEVSAKGWSRSICEIADGSSPQDCIYLAVDEAAGETQGQLAGLVMGGQAKAGPWEGAGRSMPCTWDMDTSAAAWGGSWSRLPSDI